MYPDQLSQELLQPRCCHLGFIPNVLFSANQMNSHHFYYFLSMFFYYSCVNCTKWTCPKLLLCVTVEQEKNFNLNNLLIMKQWSGSTVQKPTNRIWIFGVASWSNTFKKCGITSLPITDACVLSSTSCWSRDYQEAGALLYI